MKVLNHEGETIKPRWIFDVYTTKIQRGFPDLPQEALRGHALG
jgi:hypothetical protein